MELAKSVFYSIVFVSLNYLVGHYILKLFKTSLRNDYTSVFIKVVTGLFLLVPVFAIVRTKGNTILLGIFIILFFLIYDFWKEGKFSHKQELTEKSTFFLTKVFFELLIVISCLVIYKLTFRQVTGFFSDPHYGDSIFYSKISKYLIETGIENSNLDYVFYSPIVLPYHYFELWINALLLKVVGGNAVALLLLTSYTIGCAIIWIGFISLAELFFKPGALVKVLSFLLIFQSGTYWGNLFHQSLIESTNVFTVNVVDYPKLFPLFIIFILIVIAFHKERMNLVITLLLLLPLINISTAPGVFILISILIIVNIILKNRTVIPITIAKSVVMGLFILTFYYLKGETRSDAISGQGLGSYLEFSYVKTVLNIMVGATIQYIIIYFPLFLLFVMLYKTHQRYFYRYMSVVSMVFLSFIIPWAVFHNVPNSVQLFSNGMVSFIACFSIYFAFAAYTLNPHNNIYKGVSFILLVALPSVSLLSDIKERLQLKNTLGPRITAKEIQFFETTKNPLGVYFKSRQHDWANRDPVFGSLDAPYQQFVDRSGLHTISLSVLDTALEPGIHFNYEKKIVVNSIFGKYVNAKKASNDRSIFESQVSFIRDYNISYVIAEKDYHFSDPLKKILKEEFFNESIGVRIFSVKN